VQYRDFTVSDEPDSDPLHETVVKDQLRPFPPQLPRKRFKVRDAVETLYNDAWWVGFIKHHNPKDNTYQVYYGAGQPELELPFSHIRSRQEYVRPSGPELKWSWSIVRPMQNPPPWEPRAKVKEAQIHLRLKLPAHRLVYGSDDSQDEKKGRQERRQPTKRRRVESKSALAKPQAPPRIRVIKFPKPEMEVIAINAPPPKVSEQSMVSLTPGSSPPAHSPQDFDSWRGSDSQVQNALVTTELSPQRRSSSSSSSSGSSGDSGTNSSSEDGVNAGVDGVHSEEDESIHKYNQGEAASTKDQPELSIFTDLNADRTIDDRAAYKKLLERFRDSSKGVLDKWRHELLQGIREELQLSLEFCRQAHCEVFGVFV
jgi:hypothetical protein